MDSMNLIMCAIAAAGLDVCALVILLSSYAEKRAGRKIWGKISANMVLTENDVIYPLECDEILIGRHASADIRLPDLSVSRYHAMLNVTDGKWTINDIGSKSGVYVNGELIQHARLHDGDVIMLGNRRLVFRRISPDNFS